MTRTARERALLIAATALFATAWQATLRRSGPLPAPESMLSFVAAPPPRSNDVRSRAMTQSIAEVDTTVQELRVETHRAAFVQKLARIVDALGAIPDGAPQSLSRADLARLRDLADEAVDAIEQRIDSGADDEKVQQQLAGTVYEIRRRMEAIEVWFRHFH